MSVHFAYVPSYIHYSPGVSCGVSIRKKLKLVTEGIFVKTAFRVGKYGVQTLQENLCWVYRHMMCPN